MEPSRSRLTDEQIAFVLRQAGPGMRVPYVCRGGGVSEATFHDLEKGGARIYALLSIEYAR